MSDQNLETRVRETLSQIQDPETGRKLAKQIHEVSADADQISVKVGLTSFASPLINDFQEQVNS